MILPYFLPFLEKLNGGGNTVGMDESGQAATVGVSSSWWAGSQTEYPTNCGYCSVQLRKGARDGKGVGWGVMPNSWTN